MKLLPLKFTCLLALFAGATLSNSHAVLLAYEGFDYAAAANVTGQTGGTGNWNGAWTGPTSTTVTSPGLTYTGLTTSGNTSFESNSASSGNRRSWTGLDSSNGAELWFSVLLNSTATGSDLRLFVLNADVTSGSDSGVGVNINGLAINARVNTSTSASTGLSLTSGVTSLLVGRLSFSDTAGADAITIWLDPTLGGGTPGGGFTLNGDFNSALFTNPNFGYRGGFGWLGSVDEVRIGTTFADVTVPEPAAFSLALAGGLALLLRRRRAVI